TDLDGPSGTDLDSPSGIDLDGPLGTDLDDPSGTDLVVSLRNRSSQTMDTTIDYQVAIDEALVPHAKRLRIGKSNFRQLSDIKSKESTLQLVYDVMRLCPFFKAFLVEHKDSKKSNEMYYPQFTKFIIHHFMSNDPSIPRRNKVNWHYVRNNHMFSTIKLVFKHQNTQQFGALLPIELTNEEIRNSNAYKEYYVTHISQASGSGADKGTGSIPGVLDVPTDESGEELSWNSTKDKGDDDEGKDGDGDEEDDGDNGEEGDGNDDEDDEGEEGDDDDDDQEIKRDDEKDDKEDAGDNEQDSDEEEFIHPSLSTHAEEEPMDEESFDPIPKTPKDTDDEGNGEEDLGLHVGREEGHDEEEEEDELYRDININQGRGIQTTQEVEDSHVTLTSVNLDGQQQSSSVSSQFVTSMLNPILDVENDEFLKTIDENMQKIIKGQVKEQVKVQVSKILPKIEQTVNEQLEAEVLTRSSHSSKTSYAVAADLSRMELKKILIEKMEGNKSIQRSDEQRNLYKAIVEAYESNKIILDTYGETVTLKRRRNDDANKDEEPFARPDRGSKGRREGKEPESASAPKEKATRSAGKSTQGTKSRQASASESATHPEWFSQQQKPLTLDREWNKTLPTTHKSIQPWIRELAKQSDSRSSFNELMDTPLEFSNFLINQLKVDTLTLELIAGPTYELLKGSSISTQSAQASTIDTNNRGRRVIPFEHFINNDLEYLCGGASSRKYTTSVTKTKAADYGHIKWIEDLVPRTMWIEEPIGYKHAFWGRRVEDLQLGVESYQKKLNLTKLDTYRSDLKRKEAYTAYSNPRGFIYQNKDKKNMLIRIDELHKFSDGTLTDVRTALDDRLKGIRMKYLPQSIWRKSDKDRAAAMIQAIDKRLKTRRIMRSLERFDGGRLYEGDFRMLQRTI
nr:hypothetical protein [Tanacetum cinerariifolium]